MTGVQRARPGRTIVIGPSSNRRSPHISPGQAIFVDALHQNIFRVLFVFDEGLLIGYHEIVHAAGYGVFLVNDFHFERAKRRAVPRLCPRHMPTLPASSLGLRIALTKSKGAAPFSRTTESLSRPHFPPPTWS